MKIYLKNTIQLTQPALPVELVDYLIKNKGSYRYILEYGSGASTFLLAENFYEVISIESDLSFKRLIQKQIKKNHLNVTLLWANIGPTSRYGHPRDLFRKYFESKYENYSKLPFSKIKFVNADLVLVDGRFRVACVLSCILNLNQPFDLIVDDFIERHEYHILFKTIECKRYSYFGRSILFEQVVPKKNLELKKMLDMYKTIVD